MRRNGKMTGIGKAKKNGRHEHAFVFVVLMVLIAVMIAAGADVSHARDSEWSRFQGNEENNGITNVLMPENYKETALKWGKQITAGYTNSFTPPIIVDGYLITAAGSKVFKINKETGAVVAQSDEMSSNVSYAMHPITYDSEYDQYYVPLLNGRVCAVDAETLNVKWNSKGYAGFQALQPVACKNGRVFNGTWNSETDDGVFYALNAETGKEIWSLRPSELVKHTTAQDLGIFPSASGYSRNYYRYTALIKVKAKSGYEFKTSKTGQAWLYKIDEESDDDPAAGRQGTTAAVSVDGVNANAEYDETTGVATVRARYNFTESGFIRTGAEAEGGVALTGLSTPSVGSALDTSLDQNDKVTVEGIEWKTGDAPHGFYWAGAYTDTDGTTVYFGSDDGQNNTFGASGDDSYTETASFYAVDCATGAIKDRIDGCKGDIRSTAVYANGHLYFTTKGGRLYKAKLKSDGTFDHEHVSYFEVSTMMTASPVVHNGRIYVGIAGTGGQFSSDGGHKFAVFRDDVDLDGAVYEEFYLGSNFYNRGSLIYTTDIAGYPQASALLSTNTEAAGESRLYFTYNAPPGGIYSLHDSTDYHPTSEATALDSRKAFLLFRPENEMQQYSLTPVCVDGAGTMYLKNDSGYLMAVALNKAWADDISVEYDNTELVWEGGFESGTLNYKLRAPNEATQVAITLTLPEGVTAETGIKNADGSITGRTAYTGPDHLVDVPEDPESERVAVIVSKTTGGSTYSRTYALKIVPDSNNANLSGIILNNSNSLAATNIPLTTDESYPEKVMKMNTSGLGYDPAYDINTTKYVSRTVNNNKTFVNVWCRQDDPKATIKAYPVDSVGNSTSNMNTDDFSIKIVKSGALSRIPVYWIKGKISSEIRIEVTSPSGNEVKNYNVELVRSQTYIDIGTEPLLLSKSSATLYTKGANTTTNVTATLGDSDVTSRCIWESSRPDIATVDANGNIATAGKAGEAVIWARYLGQDTEESPMRVTVVVPTAGAPSANIVSGTYDQQKQIYLSTTSDGAEIRYNVGEGTNVDNPTSTTGTVFNENSPITLGERGKKKTYRIRALACNNGYGNSTVSTFDYTIDLRTKIPEVTVADIDTPVAKQQFDSTASCTTENVNVSEFKWYEKDDHGDLTEVTGIAERDKEYVAAVTLIKTDADSLFTGATKGVFDGAYRTVEYVDEGTVVVYIPFTTLQAPVAAAPTSNVASGAYDVAKEIYLSTVSSGAEIRYNVTAGGEAEWPSPDSGTVYDGPISLGVAGKKTTYSIKAIACNGIYDSDETSRASFDYTIDLRSKITEVVLTGLDAPVALEAFDDSVDNGDERVEVISLKWYEEDNGGELTEVTGPVEYEKKYVAKIKVGVKENDDHLFDSGTQAKVDGAYRRVELDGDDQLTVSVSFSTEIMPTAVAPIANPVPGIYYEEKSVTLSSDSSGAEIRYTMGDSAVEPPSEQTGYVFDDPVVLGEQGKKRTYRIKAIAWKEGIYKVSSVSAFDYTIDLRKRVTEAAVTDLDEPFDGAALDTGVSVGDDSVSVDSVKWFERDDDDWTEVTGQAEGGKTYMVKVTLTTDTESAVFADSVRGSINGADRSVVFDSEDPEGKIVVSAQFTPKRVIKKIECEGVTEAVKFENPVEKATLTTSGVKIEEVYWTDEDDTKYTDEFKPASKYTVNVRVSVEDGHMLKQDFTATIKKNGVKETADIKDNGDGTYMLALEYVTGKLQVSGEADNVIVDPEELKNLPHGTTETELRALLAGVKVKVRMEDGTERDVAVYWKAEPKGHEGGKETGDIDYDPGNYSRQTFNVTCNVTGFVDRDGNVTDITEEELGGVVLKPSVKVTVLEGKVEPPVFSPQSKVYKEDQTVTISTKTPGAAIQYTRSDMPGETFTYSEPIPVTAEFGADKTVTFKAFAIVNGVQSETVTYTIEINKKSGDDDSQGGGSGGKSDTDVSKNSIDKITPNDKAANAAKENKSIGKVTASKMTTVGNVKKKEMKIKFPAVKDASNYRVAYRKAGAKDWEYAWSKGETTYVIKGMKQGSLLEFKIAVYRPVSGEWQRSAWSDVSYGYMETVKPKYKAAKKKINVTLKKVKKASGYDVMYSLKKNMKGAKTRSLKGAKKTKVTLKNLKSKKQYFVAVRPYKKYKGKTYIGILSAKKKVKVK